MSGADVVRSDDERKARYIERQEAKQQKLSELNAQRVAERIARLDHCAEIIRQRGSATARELAEQYGLNHHTVKKWLQHLHEQGRIYIAEYVWRDGSQKRVPNYKIGNLPDAEFVRIAGPTLDEEDSEKISSIEVARKHDEWKKTWTPHCDVAASWI
jgi:hypothetical protein